MTDNRILHFLYGFVFGVGVFCLLSYTYIREGQTNVNKIKYTIDGKYIREGQNPYGKILYTIDGKYIRKGQDPCGQIMFNITDK